MSKITVDNIPNPSSISLLDRRDSREYYKEFWMGRRDIALIQFNDVCNCFYFVDGRIQIDVWSRSEVDEFSKDIIEKIARHKFETELLVNYVESHKRFFASL